MSYGGSASANGSRSLTVEGREKESLREDSPLLSSAQRNSVSVSRGLMFCGGGVLHCCKPQFTQELWDQYIQERPLVTTLASPMIE